MMALEGQFGRAPGATSRQETVTRNPEQTKNPTELWAEQARDLVNRIDANYQLQVTLPGLRFAEDLARLLDESVTGSRTEFSQLLDNLYQDLQSHEFMIHFETGNIHMADETSSQELGDLFKQFSSQLSQFPIPGFDKELADKRNKLVEAFANRGKMLAG